MFHELPKLLRTNIKNMLEDFQRQILEKDWVERWWKESFVSFYETLSRNPPHKSKCKSKNDRRTTWTFTKGYWW